MTMGFYAINIPYVFFVITTVCITSNIYQLFKLHCCIKNKGLQRLIQGPGKEQKYFLESNTLS